jgi:EAL domain-containing protein (putative c-di-GMP-specific phosphodiesterase class I)/GGDEF domain-containing protein
VVAFVAIALGLVASGAGVWAGTSVSFTAFVVVGGHAAVACVAALAARNAARAGTGVSRAVWRLFTIGLGLWFAGCLTYLAFLGIGGSPSDPAAWTQLGFLCAYVPWYRALWLMRQPILAPSRRKRAEGILVEVVAFALLGVVVGKVLWQETLTADQNIALLLPTVLDLLLLAGLYNAVRRSHLTLAGAHAWFALAFLALAVTDSAVTLLVPQGRVELAGLALSGYAVALGFIGAAATRPLRVTETRRGAGRSSAALGLLSLAFVAPASSLLPREAAVASWAIGVAIVAWLWQRVAKDDDSDVDVLTGMLRPEALSRHLAGVLAFAREERPAGLIVFEIEGLAAWTEQHGFKKTDALLTRVAAALEDLDLAEGGTWSHLRAERFAWLGVIADEQDGRALAHRIRDAGVGVCAPLGGHCGVALIPGDADTPEDAVDAAVEAAVAARTSNRPAVLFGRGHLDGLPADPGYGTSLRVRRARILEIMESQDLLVPVFQPIVDLENMQVRGYEALSRFMAEPRQGPDVWIAEAHALGLGIELEAECIRRAVAKRHEAPSGRYISLNTSPELLMSPVLDETLAGHSLHGLVLEITEHHHVSDYALIADRLATLRGRGVRVAVDDVGAGHSSMRHVMNLRPDMIKVDRWMVTDINIDSGKRALMRSFVALSAELGATLVIEGVETAEELAALRELGALVAQGYLFARPEAEFGEATIPPPATAPETAPAIHAIAPVAG